MGVDHIDPRQQSGVTIATNRTVDHTTSPSVVRFPSMSRIVSFLVRSREKRPAGAG